MLYLVFFSCVSSETSFLTRATALKQYTSAVLGDLPNFFAGCTFCYLGQNQPSAFPWGMIHWELWMRSHQPLNKKRSLPGNSFRSRPPEFSNVPFGYCFKFHKGGHCAGCSFKHSCLKCEGTHRMSICTFSPHSKQLPRTTTNAKSSGAKSSPPNANKAQ